MSRWIDYIDAGGIWAWLALAAGLIGVLTVVMAVGKRYKQPSAVFAIEMGLVAFALGAVGWYVNDATAQERRQRAHETLGLAPSRDAARSAAADEITARIEADAAEQVMRPVDVAIRAGGAAIALGAVLFLVAGPTSKSRRA